MKQTQPMTEKTAMREAKRKPWVRPTVKPVASLKSVVQNFQIVSQVGQ